MDEGKSLQQAAVWAVGTMSGTSLDGVDAALLLTDGVSIEAFGDTLYRPYSEGERDLLRAALGKWPGEAGVAEAAAVVAAAHLEALAQLEGAEIAGIHGQTLAHEPKGRGTHQTGAGPELAAQLGLPLVWDFRSADVAAGGEGAPLAPVYHWALARYIGASEPVAFLNMGGVGNITWVNPLAEDPFAPGALLAFDTGPANAPVNDLMQRRLGLSVDQDGALAGAGTVLQSVVEDFLADRFFTRRPPKSLDRDAFVRLGEAVGGLPDADAAATLVYAAAAAVEKAVAWCPSPPSALYVTGGGRHNRTMMGDLAALLPCPVAPVEAVGLDGDMLEAQAFAYMAVRAARGLAISGPATTGVSQPLSGGQIAWP